MSSNAMSEAGALYPTFPDSHEIEHYNELTNRAAEALLTPTSATYGKKRPSHFWQSVNLCILITCLVLITLAADYHVMTSTVG